ncbi:MAG: DNA gyrase inhibitor YacG [Sterolibacterium sp.]|nr:DNA gyrase inhibitor YacG [Sterolibacterium sp.]
MTPLLATPRTVNCPACGKAVAWVEENRYRPFCSERCKLIDFGAWAADEYRVPEQEHPLSGSQPD